MRLLLLIGFKIAGATDRDACGILHRGSVCDEEVGQCTNLIWVDTRQELFLFDAFGLSEIDPYVEHVTCADAESLIGSGALVDEYMFDERLFTSMRQEIQSQVDSSFLPFIQHFPFVSTAQSERLSAFIGVMGAEPEHKSPGSVERMFVKKAVCESSNGIEITELMHSHLSSITSMRKEKAIELSRRILPFVNAFHSFRCLGFGNFELYQLIDRATALALAARVHAREDYRIRALSDPEIGLEFAELIDKVHEEAIVASQTASYTDHSMMMRKFVSLISMMSADGFRELLDTNSHLALLFHQFIGKICKSITAVVAYMFQWNTFTDAYVPLLLELCGSFTSTTDVVYTSTVAAPPNKFDHSLMAGQTVLRLTGTNTHDQILESLNFLGDPSSEFLSNFVVIAENSGPGEFVTEARMRWIVQMIEVLFPPFSGEQRRLAASTSEELSSQIAVVRASGRALGLAIRYRVPVPVHFSDMFLQLLRMYQTEAELRPLFDMGAIDTGLLVAMSVLRDGIADVIGPIALSFLSDDELRTLFYNPFAYL